MRPTERAVVLVLRGHAGDVEFGAIPQLYNAVRLHSSLGYRPPAPETVLTASQSIQTTT